MTISVDPLTYIITIPKADLTLVQSVPTEIREMNLDDFRGWLNDWEDNPEGMVQPKTHTHNTEVSLGGLTYARVIELLDPYTLTFEDAQYAVNLIGANSNVGDKVNVNQVSVRSQNSAGLISAPDIEYASFQDAIWIDPISGDDGNIGNRQKPVQTVPDSLIKADYRGVNILQVLNDLAFTTGATIDGMHIEGQSYVRTNITLETESTTVGISVANCILDGYIDGTNDIHGCVIVDLHGFNGHIRDCGFKGDIFLNGNENSYMAGCNQIDFGITPGIDMGGTGQNLVLIGYTGILRLTNMTGANIIGIGLTAGRVILDSTSITNGTIHISGTGLLVDELNQYIGSGTWNGGVTIINELTSSDSIASSKKIYLDTINGVSGTSNPIGSIDTPSNNLSDTLEIASFYHIDTIHVIGSLTIVGEDVIGFTFLSTRSLGNSVVVTSMVNTGNCYFENLTVSGTMSGGVRYTTCVLGEIHNFDGGAKNSLVIADIYFTGTNNNYLTECDTYVTSTGVISLHQNTASLNIIRGRGRYGIVDKTSTDITAIDLVSGFVYVDVSCDSGEVHVGGIGSVDDQSSDGCTVRQGAINNTYIANAVWDVDLLDHNLPETTGSAANDVSYTEKQIYINLELAINGNGKSSSPFNVVADAVDFAELVGWRHLVFLSDASLERTLKNFVIEGVGLPTIDFDGQNVDKSEFTKVKLTGEQQGSITSEKVILLPGLSNLSGTYKEVAVVSNSTYTIADEAVVNLFSVSTEPYSATVALVPPTFDLVAGRINQILVLRKASGTYQIENMDDSSNILTAQFAGGGITFAASCTDGIAKIVSTMDDAIINNGAITVVEKDTRPSAQTISTTVLDDIA